MFFSFPVPLSEGGLFSGNAGRHNNYLLEGWIQTLNYKMWLTISEDKEDGWVGDFFRVGLSYVALHNSKLFRVFSWIRSLKMDMPQLPVRTMKKINTDCHSGGEWGTLISHWVSVKDCIFRGLFGTGLMHMQESWMLALGDSPGGCCRRNLWVSFAAECYRLANYANSRT